MPRARSIRYFFFKKEIIQFSFLPANGSGWGADEYCRNVSIAKSDEFVFPNCKEVFENEIKDKTVDIWADDFDPVEMNCTRSFLSLTHCRKLAGKNATDDFSYDFIYDKKTGEVTSEFLQKFKDGTYKDLIGEIEGHEDKRCTLDQQPAEQFFEKYILQTPKYMPEPGDLGGFDYYLPLALALSWIVVFLCLCKGVKSSGKVWNYSLLDYCL